MHSPFIKVQLLLCFALCFSLLKIGCVHISQIMINIIAI